MIMALFIFTLLEFRPLLQSHYTDADSIARCMAGQIRVTSPKTLSIMLSIWTLKCMRLAEFNLIQL
jgi:hypothetical protein